MSYFPESACWHTLSILVEVLCKVVMYFSFSLKHCLSIGWLLLLFWVSYTDSVWHSYCACHWSREQFATCLLCFPTILTRSCQVWIVGILKVFVLCLIAPQLQWSNRGIHTMKPSSFLYCVLMLLAVIYCGAMWGLSFILVHFCSKRPFILDFIVKAPSHVECLHHLFCHAGKEMPAAWNGVDSELLLEA